MSNDSDSDCSSGHNSDEFHQYDYGSRIRSSLLSDNESESSETDDYGDSVTEESSSEEEFDLKSCQEKLCFIYGFDKKNKRDTFFICYNKNILEYRKKYKKLNFKDTNKINALWGDVKVYIPELGHVLLKTYDENLSDKSKKDGVIVDNNQDDKHKKEPVGVNNKNKKIDVKPDDISKFTGSAVANTKSNECSKNSNIKVDTKNNSINKNNVKTNTEKSSQITNLAIKSTEPVQSTFNNQVKPLDSKKLPSKNNSSTIKKTEVSIKSNKNGEILKSNVEENKKSDLSEFIEKIKADACYTRSVLKQLDVQKSSDKLNDSDKTVKSVVKDITNNKQSNVQKPLVKSKANKKTIKSNLKENNEPPDVQKLPVQSNLSEKSVKPAFEEDNKKSDVQKPSIQLENNSKNVKSNLNQNNEKLSIQDSFVKFNVNDQTLKSVSKQGSEESNKQKTSVKIDTNNKIVSSDAKENSQSNQENIVPVKVVEIGKKYIGETPSTKPNTDQTPVKTDIKPGKEIVESENKIEVKKKPLKRYQISDSTVKNKSSNKQSNEVEKLSKKKLKKLEKEKKKQALVDKNQKISEKSQQAKEKNERDISNSRLTLANKKKSKKSNKQIAKSNTEANDNLDSDTEGNMSDNTSSAEDDDIDLAKLLADKDNIPSFYVERFKRTEKKISIKPKKKKSSLPGPLINDGSSDSDDFTIRKKRTKNTVVSKADCEKSDKLGEKAIGLILQNDVTNAILCLTKAMFLNPTDCRHYLNRSYCHLRVEKFSFSLNDAQYVIQNSKNLGFLFMANLRAGQATHLLKKYQQAEAFLREALRLFPNSPHAQRELLRVQIKLIMDYDHPEKHAIYALETNSSTADAIKYLNDNYIPRDDIDETKDFVFNDDYDDQIFDDFGDENCNTTQLNKLMLCKPEEIKLYHVAQPFMSWFKPVTETDRQKTSPIPGIPLGKNVQMTENAVWVGNLTNEINEPMIKKFFKQYGHIWSVHRPEGKAFAFINFEKSEDAAKLLKNNAVKFYGRELVIRSAFKKID